MTLSQNAVRNLEALFRDNPEVRQEDLAAEARRCGLDWSQSTVANLLAGSRQLRTEELVLLPLVVLGAFGVDSNLWALLVDDREEMVPLQDGVRISRGELNKLLSGATASELNSNTAGLDLPWTRTRSERSAGAERYRHLWPSASIAKVRAALVESRNEAVQKAARKLAVAPEVVAVRAMHLWGRPLAGEREARVQARVSQEVEHSPRSLQAQRGHVTRELVVELRESLDTVDGQEATNGAH